MSFEDINFPVYRKYKNSRSYFKIINPRLFEEVQIIGSKRFVKTVEARQFPEMNFIHDLIYNYSSRADEISAQEYDEIKK